MCRELGVSEATYHRWRNQFGGLKAEDAKRLKDLERRTRPSSGCWPTLSWRRRPKGDREGKLLGPERRRAAVTTSRSWGSANGSPAASPGSTAPPSDTSPPRRRRLTRTRRCGVAARSSQGASAARVPAGLPRRPRRGLDRQPQEIQRLWREEGLRVPQRRRRKRPGPPRRGTTRPPSPQPGVGGGLPVRRHHRRTADQDLSIIDGHTRECLGGLVQRSITGEDLIAELDRLAAERGAYPRPALRQRPRISLQRNGRLGSRTGRPVLHPPGEPWRNGYVESFNSRIRDECLNINSFWSLPKRG